MSHFVGRDAVNSLCIVLQPYRDSRLQWSAAVHTDAVELRCRVTLKISDTQTAWYCIVLNGRVSRYFSSISIPCNTTPGKV